MINVLVERINEKGIYRLQYLSEPEAQGEPAGLYVDIARFDGTGYSERVGSYVKGAHAVYREYGEYPEFAGGSGEKGEARAKIGTTETAVTLEKDAPGGPSFLVCSTDSNPVYGTTGDRPRSWRKRCATREEAMLTFRRFVQTDLERM